MAGMARTMRAMRAMSNMVLKSIAPQHVPFIWPSVRNIIAAAMGRLELSAFWPTEQAVLNGGATLWIVCDEQQIYGAVITEIQEMEWARFCMLTAFGGHLKTSLPFLEVIEDYAHAMECKAIRIMGPNAWQRILPADYLQTAVVLEKVL